MKLWEKLKELLETPMSVEDIELIAHHHLLAYPGSVRSYTMINGQPVYVGEHLTRIRQAIESVIPAFEKLGQAFVDITPQFEAFGENFRKAMQQ